MSSLRRPRYSIVRRSLTPLALAVLSVPAACTGGNGSNNDAAACRTFRTDLSVQDRMSQSAALFVPGEPITFALQITNTTNAPATLTASSSCTAVAFEVFDVAKQRRWGSADGIACVQTLQPRTYAPLETATESSTWDQQDSAGAAVPPGMYTVSAKVGEYASDSQGLVDCSAQLSKSATFTIQ